MIEQAKYLDGQTSFLDTDYDGLPVFVNPVSGELTNSPPCNRRETFGGEDTVVLSLGVHWGEADSLFAKLESLKRRQQDQEAGDTASSGRLDIGGHTAIVASSGGGGKNAFTHRWRFDVSGCTFRIRAKGEGTGEQPNVSIELHSLALMVNGLETMVAHCMGILSELGGTVKAMLVSRVDIRVDLLGVATGDVVKLMQAEHYVTRGRKVNWWSDDRKFTGVTIGTGDVILRIYDKLNELGKSDVKRTNYIQRAGIRDGDVVTRVEFQMRREFLKSCNVSTYTDWLAARGDVSGYLCSEWFRLTDRAIDRDARQQDHARNHPVWDRVIEGFAAWAGERKHEISRTRSSFGEIEGLMLQLLGIASAVVSHRHDVRTVDEFLVLLRQYSVLGIKVVGEEKFLDRLVTKRERVLAEYPAEIVGTE